MIKNEIARRIFDPGTQALVDAGILTNTLAVDNGTYILEWVLLNNKEELVKFAKEILKRKEEEAKKAKGCC